MGRNCLLDEVARLDVIRDVAGSIVHRVQSPEEVSPTESLPWLGLNALLALNLLLQSPLTSGGHSTAGGIPWGGVQALWGAKA